MQSSFREDNYVDGGEDYMTFSGCSVNIGQAMNPKSGEFTVPEPGLYLFLVTCCTFDMKKCLLSIRKNGKDVANIFDQDGDTNKVSKQTTTPFLCESREIETFYLLFLDVLLLGKLYRGPHRSTQD